jgi:hypothetical protein
VGEGNSKRIEGLPSRELGCDLRLGMSGLEGSSSEDASDETLPRRAWRGWLCRRTCSSFSGERRSGPLLGDVTGDEFMFSGKERRRERARRGGSGASGARNWRVRTVGFLERPGRTGRAPLLETCW